MRDVEWETPFMNHQHAMIKRLDALEKGSAQWHISKDEMMVQNRAFISFACASMLDLARYVLISQSLQNR